MNPRVSLYIPTHGREKLLMRALRSALTQTFSDLEVIVVIDGPDEHTRSALQGVADDRLHIIQREARGGACQARNDAIFAARGELITGLDDDDELEQDHVKNLVELLDTSGAPFVATSSVVIRDEGTLIRHGFTGPITLDALLFENVIGNQVLTKTSYLRELGVFDPEMPAWQDYDLWVRLAHRYGTGLKTDQRSYLQYHNHGASRITERTRIIAAHRRFVAKHQALLEPRHLASLELLVLATTHEKFDIKTALRLASEGFAERSATAYLANQFPGARSTFLQFRRRLDQLVRRLLNRNP
jgi:glycosyltransferase involved in cell wall biosynthesis